MKIMIVSDIDASKNNGAGNVVVLQELINFLSKNNDYKLIFLNLNSKKSRFLCESMFSKLAFLHLLALRVNKLLKCYSLLDYKKNILSKLIFIISKWYHKPDVVIIQYLELSFLRSNDKITYICDLHDLMHLRRESYLSAHVKINPSVNIEKNDEFYAINKFDKVIAIQELDNNIINSKYPQKSICLPRSYNGRVIKKNRNNKQTILGFIGGNSDFNIASLKYIFSEFPDIVKSYKILVAGSVCDSFNDVIFPDNITLIGYIDDVSDFYKRIDILINPIVFGSGLKTKNLEAVSFGVPVITTELGAQGLNVLINKCVFLAKKQSEYLQIIDLISNEYDKFQLQCEMNYNKHYAGDIIFEEFKMYLESLR